MFYMTIYVTYESKFLYTYKRSQPDKGIMIRGRVVRDKRRICVSSQLGANSKHSFLISWPCCSFTAQSVTSFAAKGVIQKEGLRRARWTPDVADTQEHLSVGCSRVLAAGGAGHP